ncbi:MAG: phenylacetate-CoA oxygenase subunit PaaJ [Planctomycetes bacterium]|nr:phenylacetate-CoA oxygenase subunit PaaJ [Planctomycetota bacterium]
MSPANDNTTESSKTQKTSPRERAVWRSLEGVLDPEIPVINVIDLGIIAAVRAGDEGVEVDMTPTFAGCPALDVIRQDIAEAVKAIGEDRVTVNVVYDPPWTSDRITPDGRRKLKEFGLAPPGKRCTGGELPNLESTLCPYCDSTNTEMESIFGPTLCRSIHYCHACKQSFEHFKAV